MLENDSSSFSWITNRLGGIKQYLLNKFQRSTELHWILNCTRIYCSGVILIHWYKTDVFNIKLFFIIFIENYLVQSSIIFSNFLAHGSISNGASTCSYFWWNQTLKFCKTFTYWRLKTIQHCTDTKFTTYETYCATPNGNRASKRTW